MTSCADHPACSGRSDVSLAPDCRSRLLQAACEVFVAEGYRVGVDRIAARAGVAKQTLYNHFSSKADLFGAVIREATAEMLVSLGNADDGLRERLERFGALYRNKLLCAAGIGLYRVMVAESVRFPELAVMFYRSGPMQTDARLREVIVAAMQEGRLRRDDPDFAVTALLSLLVGKERSRLLFSAAPIPLPDPADAVRIVDCFLRAFSPAMPHAFPAAD